jgi:ubiquitin-conjugating enzyme E2 M
MQTQMLVGALERRRLQPLIFEFKKVIFHEFIMRQLLVQVAAGANTLFADLSELSLPSTMKTEFKDPDDLLNFELTIEPDEGMYKGGQFHFSFEISQEFPHQAPKVLCKEKIYHPNIDLQGKVCLNILREDWKPVLNLQAVIVGLQV